jgi:hypothetical protein
MRMVDPALRAWQLRRALILGGAFLGPLAALGIAWVLVDRLVLTPAVPPIEAPAEAHVEFIAHARGLSRLNGEAAQAFLRGQMRRLADDEAFRLEMVAALNRSSIETRRDFESHILDVVLPPVMEDVRRFTALPSERRRDFIDERIVAYNRLASAYRPDKIDQPLPLAGVLSGDRLMRMLMEKIDQRERDDAVLFASLYRARVDEIVADAALKRQFEQRIAAGDSK